MIQILLVFTIAFIYGDAKFPNDAINEFILSQNRPTTVTSFLTPNAINLAKALKKTSIKIEDRFQDGTSKEDHPLYIADLLHNGTTNILVKAQKEYGMIIPRRWLLIMDLNQKNGSPTVLNEDSLKENVEKHLKGIRIGINTEVYTGFSESSGCNIYSVYRRNPESALIWSLYGSWNKSDGFKLANRSGISLPMSRKDLQGYPVRASCVITVNASLDHLEDYLRRDEDTYTKYSYYMVKHAVEFMNGTFVVNFTDTWGYPQPDGSFNGAGKEIYEGRADFGGSPFAPIAARLKVFQFTISPASMKAMFIFKKPSLAAIANIFVLPFSRGVWAGIVVLIILCSITLFVSSFIEERYSDNEDITKETIWARMSNSVLDSLSFVFQQGVCRDAISISSRQVLLLGLMVFMFLFTCYSANVVALLQSTTNDINDVKDLLRSPLKLGLQDVVYNQFVFASETRPAHQALYQQKILSQGDKAYSTVEEGIRRVRKGMYAFHVQQTAGYDEIQRTFWDDEKCNLGQVVYTSFASPYLGVGHKTHVKELFKIGCVRVFESGVQSRSTRRVVAARPTCASQAAMFAAVELAHVGPAFRAFLTVMAVAVCLLIGEIVVFRHKKKKEKRIPIRNTILNNGSQAP